MKTKKPTQKNLPPTSSALAERNSSLSQERRRYERVDRHLSIRHRLHKRSKKIFKEPWMLSTTENMSYNGILFNSTVVYKKDDLLEIEVNLSGMIDVFRGFGKVVRIEKVSSAQNTIAVKLVGLKGKSL